MKFKSSSDTTTVIVSTAIVMLFFYFTKIEWENYKENTNLSFAQFLYVFRYALLLLLLLGISYYLGTKFYQITSTGILIKKRLGQKEIRYNEIDSVQRMFVLDAYIRIFGIGGLFGYTGIFLSTSSELIYLYTNHRYNLIRINRNNKSPIYIAPDNATQFLDECGKKGVKILNEN